MTRAVPEKHIINFSWPNGENTLPWNASLINTITASNGYCFLAGTADRPQPYCAQVQSE